jgi:MFS transporter, MHS family, proline/betaine transporter
MSPKKVILISILGNALEFYDFTLYGVFAAIIANQYFPGSNETARLLSSLAAFAAGFLTRPLGAILFGHIGDRWGRKKALSLSLLSMGIPTVTIGLLPGYASIGITASMLIFLCRLLQGVFAGGEYNGAAIYSIEHVGKRFPGFIGGLITGSCVIGAFLATYLGSVAMSPVMPSWAWRVPFFFGGAISFFGYFIRRKMDETPEFLASGGNKKPLVEAFRKYPRSCFLTFVLGGFNGALTYTLFGFLNIYLSRYCGMTMEKAMQLNLIGLLTFMVGSPLMGFVLDGLGPKIYFRWVVVGICLLSFPIFLGLNSRVLLPVVVAQAVLGLCVASIAGSAHALMQDLFPVADRYSGIAFNFSLGMGLLGAVTPMLYVTMIEKFRVGVFFPAYFLIGSAVFFGLVMNVVGFKPLRKTPFSI